MARSRPSVRRGAAARVQAARLAARAGRRFGRLVTVMAHLRSPRGCPWDRRQTFASLRPFLLEETYEAIDAIDRRHFAGLCEELGDLLFEVVFLAQLAAEAGRFDVADALDTVIAKLVRRHPHVFGPTGQVHLTTPEAVVEQWERRKAEERPGRGILDGIPRSLPALARAYTIGTRAAAVGFDWTRAVDVLAKIDEELDELQRALRRGTRRQVTDELGDLLFAVANLARKLAIDPEAALARANDKFARRFLALERRLAARGQKLGDLGLAELDREWERVKNVKAIEKSRKRQTTGKH